MVDRLSMQQFIRDRVRIDDELGCWIWQQKIEHHGYGRVTVPPRVQKYVHRVAYEAFVGAIPPGLQIDHLCRVRACCNPAHLEVVTCRTNIQRKPDFGWCPSGHSYTPENTYLRPSGGRSCRICLRAKWERRRLARAAARAEAVSA